MKNTTKGGGAQRKRPASFNVVDALRDFGFRAYSAALDFYTRHHDDPAALAAYVEAAGAGFNVPADRDSIEAFAYHLSEVLRIGRAADFITSKLYNDLADAWNEGGINDMPSLTEFQESADYIARALKTAGRQRAARKGGEGR